MKTICAIFFIVLLCCSLSAQDAANPAAPGFDAANSDPAAIRIADQVMEAMGGRRNWDTTRYLKWNFFGRRQHTWDRFSGDYRMESDHLLVLMNLQKITGRAWKDGVEVTHPDSLQKILQQANSIWINDSYWLIMPYKLKDSGVTLKYLGKKPNAEGKNCEVLQLTFKNVGDTPQNKYLVYVDPETHLVCQWDYFENAADEQPRISTPWKNWRPFGNILLSGDRGKRQISGIEAPPSVPAETFRAP